MTVDSLGNALIEIMHCSTSEFRVGVSLMIQPCLGQTQTLPLCKLSRCVACVYLYCQWGVIDCEITDEISDFILAPLDEFPVGVIPSRSFHKSGTRGKLCLINLPPRAQIFRQGQPLATAALATEVGIPEASVRQVRAVSSFEVPSHINGILDDIRINAPPDVRDEAVRLITQYSDVFAVSDLNLGEFAAIEHHIETGEARPVKQRMRRTQAVFQGEEEGH